MLSFTRTVSSFTYAVCEALEFEVSYSVTSYKVGDGSKESDVTIEDITLPDSGDDVYDDVLRLYVKRIDKVIPMLEEIEKEALDDYEKNGE
jgi:hypothetical protein